MKKILAMLLSAIMISTNVMAYSDVDATSNDIVSTSIIALSNLNIIDGFEDNTFRPDEIVTRAQMVKMICTTLGYSELSTVETKFTDVPKEHWASGYVNLGVSKSFIEGYNDNTFGPEDYVTYAQAVKMLVGACGYDTWASNQGGWPSGYLAYGASLNIVKNIVGTVENDTILTRGQCATLIYNALKAPILAVNGYEYDNLGNLVPKYEAQDGKNERDFLSILTEYHDAYVVKGRVSATAKTNPELETDEVKFDVELSDNYKDEKVTKGNTVANEIMYVGITNAANLLFTYSEAIVQIDEDTDEATIVAITPYGANKAVEIDADLIRTADEANGTDPFAATKPQLAVAKSESSSATTKYDLDVKKLFVNGAELTWDEENFNTYVKENTTATVTLIDATQEGSTSTDGKYDYIMVDYYVSAVVDNVSVSDTNVRIYFKESTDNDVMKLQYDPEDEDITVSFVKDGVAVDAADLVEFDVVSVAYDVTSWANSNYYEVYVSSNAPVTGMLKSYDTEENTVNIDGTDYDCVPTIDVDGYELSGEYTLYLDAMGNVAYIEEGSLSKNYGIIAGAYKLATYDYPIVRMITNRGQIKDIECKTTDIANKVIEIIKEAGKEVSGDTYLTKTDLNADMLKNLVVDYKLSNGKIRDIETVAAVNSSATIEYKESSNKLGTYALSETATKFVVVEDYLNGGSDVGTIELSALEDEVEYDVYVYGKNKNTSEYQFVVVLGGLASVRDDSDLAIVKSNAQLTEVDDEECYTMTVVRGTEEVEVSVSKGAVDVAPVEGDIIAYSVGTKGYVEAGYYFVVASGAAAKDYEDLYTAWATGTLISSDYKDIIGDDEDEAEIVFAPVYKKTNNTLEVFTSVVDGKSNVNAVKDYTIDSNANVYVYDYSKSVKFRVDAGFVPNQNASIFNKQVFDKDDKDMENVIWANVAEQEVAVNYALIKTVDGDVTDVVIYIAD